LQAMLHCEASVGSHPGVTLTPQKHCPLYSVPA
jgi:hypothetical protein